MQRAKASIVVLLTIAAAIVACGTRVHRNETAAPATSPARAPAAAPAGTAPDLPERTVNDTAAAGGLVGSAGSSAATPGARAPGTGSASALSSGGAAASGTPAPASPPVSAPGGGASVGPVSPFAPKTEIKIGEVGVFSGLIGMHTKPISDALRVWVRWINDRGGINGHSIVLLTGDTGGDPARHRSLVQEMVEKGVVAFVAQAGDVFSGAGSVEYLTQHRVPVIGSEGAAAWYYQSPVFFPQIQHSRALVQALAVGTAKAGLARAKRKLAIWTCLEAQTCKDMDEIVPKVTSKYGVTVVSSMKVSIGQPDFTAECLNTRNAGAEMIFMAADGSAISRGAASCARQGYRPTWVLVGGGILAKQHAEDPNLNGAIGIDTQAPWFLDNTPARKAWRDAVARYASGLSTTSSSMIGWVAAKLFEFAMRAAPEPYTREGLLASLWSIKADPLADLTVPYLFNPEKPATPTTCFWNVTPKNGRWISADGGQRHCFDYDPSI